jgi:hypothetical protein
MPDLSAIRLREDAVDVRWVLFIDGIRYQFTTDNGQGLGTLIGSGASSWIGLSEDAIGGVETVGARTVLPGLEMPGTIRESLDVKAGEPEPNPVTFRLHDLDDVLGPLFAREGKAHDILRQRIAPGTTATAATLLGQGGAVIDIWDRNVGIERIGPAGERRLFPCLPSSLVGFDHPVHQNGPLPGELPPVLVSDEPLAWAGRLVTLYAVYRDPDSTATDASAWPTWDLQDAAGCRAWVGVVRGVTRQRGRVYELECHGRDALFKKQLGTVTTSAWSTVSAELSYGDDSIAILFVAHYADGTTATANFDGSIFDRTLTATTKPDLITEINGFIQDAYDGTSTNYSGSLGVLDAWAVSGAFQNVSVGLDADGFYLRKATQASNQTFLEMQIALPSRVWRQLGYEPETQHFDVQHEGPTDTRQIKFKKLQNGDTYGVPVSTAINVPSSSYWRAELTTVALEATEDNVDSNEWDNDGDPRYWAPKFSTEVFALDMTGGGQIIRLGGGAAPYIEGQLTVYHSGGDVDGAASTRARYFAFRGKVQRATTGSGGAKVYDGDPVETIQVAILEWAESGYGNVSVGSTGFQPALRLVRWLDPRLFGFNHKPLSGDLEYWSGLEGEAGDDGVIECAPLHAYAYMMADTPEYAHSVLTQIWLSTGSGGGYTTGGSITAGDNSVGALPGQLFFGDDLELADMGLAIPEQLVAPLSEIRDAFDTVPGGWASAMNRIRLAYLGPYLAQDAITSLLRSRRLMHRWHGDVFGVVQLAPFEPGLADVTILERDLYPVDDDPRSLMPDQLPAPVGHLDGVRIGYRWTPGDDKVALEHVERALDADARSRTGELVEPIEDHGLLPWPWGLRPQDVGTDPWIDEARQLWGHDAADFYGRENFAAVFNVSRPKGQDIRIGTRVLVTNPWLVDSAGSYGIVNHVGVVTATELDPRTHARRCEVFIFAGQAEGQVFFAPMARVLDQAGAVLTISTDQYEHGNADIFDGQGFTEPSWSSVGGQAVAQILYRVGSTWTLGGTHTVSSYSAGSLTLGTAPATNIEYADRWVILATYDTQDANEYVRTLFGAIVLDTLQHGATPTNGRPFHP